MRFQRTFAFSTAMVAGAFVGACAIPQPTFECNALAPFWASYEIQSGAGTGTCSELPGDLINMQRYLLPGSMEPTIGIMPRRLGRLRLPLTRRELGIVDHQHHVALVYRAVLRHLHGSHLPRGADGDGHDVGVHEGIVRGLFVGGDEAVDPPGGEGDDQAHSEEDYAFAALLLADGLGDGGLGRRSVGLGGDRDGSGV